MLRRPRAPVPCSKASRGDGTEGLVGKRQFGFLEFEHALVLLDQRVLRLGQNAHQIVLGKLATS